MKQLLFGWILFAGSVAVAQERVRLPKRDRVQLTVATGYQRSDLRWSIAGNSAGQHPNVYSELKWRGVGGVSAGAALSWNLWRNWVVLGEGCRTFTASGSVSDRDYAGDNRTSPVYAGDFSARKGYDYRLYLGLGYRWQLGKRFSLTPFLGYGWSGQRLSVEDGGGLLNSSYRTWWKGPFARAAGLLQLNGRWGLSFEGDYHQVDYRAAGDWNLIRTFSHPVSFRHWGDGYGVEGGIGLRYLLRKNVALLLAGNYFTWRTGKGVDALYLVSGSTSQTQLNEVVLAGFGLKVKMRLNL